MGVPFLDLKRRYASIREELQTAITEVMGTQAFILGPYGKALEKNVAEFIGIRHAVGVASGTDALLLGLRASGLHRGEGVLTSTFTFFATAGAIHNAGGRPFFLDIDPGTFNLSPEALERFLTEECELGEGGFPLHRATNTTIRALIPVHLYGLCADMDSISTLAKKHNLTVIEDACQAMGSSYKGRKAGSLGDLAAFSFFPTKNLGGAGDGGMVTTNNLETAERVKLLRVHGSRERYIHETIGYNSRLDELQAAVLGVKLARLDEWNGERVRIAKLYRQGLEGIEDIQVAEPPPGYNHVYHQFVVRADRRDALKEYLAAHDIGSMVYYPLPLHLQPCFDFLGYLKGDFPEAERAAGEVLALPVYPGLAESELTEVCRAIGAFYEEAG